MASRRRGTGVFRVLVVLLALVAWLARRTLLRVLERGAEAVIRRRLRNYRVRVNHVDTLLPRNLEGRERAVAVVGGGLAGVAAASTLAERGFQVTLYEAAPFLGGKLASWTHTFEDGTTAPMEHGFHAFFANYYNLNRFLGHLGVEQGFATTRDYRILSADGSSMSFADLHRVPGLNIVHLALEGFFDFRETVLRNPNVDRLNDMLNYHPVDSFERLDGESYAAYADAARLPAKMQLIFKSFTRVFFAEPEQMSTAELVKSFHGFFLAHDQGLLYRYPTDDHGLTLWKPIREHLERAGVTLRLGTRVDGIERQKNGRLRVGGRPYDDVVLACDLKGAKAVLDASAALVDAEAPGLRADVEAIQPQNRYANLKVWLDRDVRPDVPGFTSTERIRALDSVTTCHRNEATWRRVVAEKGGGSVLELHAYSVPRHLVTHDDVRRALLDDLFELFPELAGAKVEREILYVKDDFTPYFVGMHARRPGVASGVDRLWLAGDWVRLRQPVMLMEAAFTSGLLAANAILDREGVRQEPVYSVPEEGLLYGIR